MALAAMAAAEGTMAGTRRNCESLVLSNSLELFISLGLKPNAHVATVRASLGPGWGCRRLDDMPVMFGGTRSFCK